MNISGICYESVVDGKGVRTVVFVSGCKHYCNHCHNPDSHDFNNGQLFSIELQDKIIDYIRNTSYISGLTLSGGDCMYLCQDTVMFLKRYKQKCNKNIWIYSGFTLEEIINDQEKIELLSMCDVLVDGPFNETLKGYNLKFIGSTNQRIIDISQTLEKKQVVSYNFEKD